MGRSLTPDAQSPQGTKARSLVKTRLQIRHTFRNLHRADACIAAHVGNRLQENIAAINQSKRAQNVAQKNRGFHPYTLRFKDPSRYQVNAGLP